MLPESILVFFFTCLVIELTPGPNMGYLTVLSLNAGRRAGFATVAGIAVGLLSIGLLAAFGVAEIVSASPLALRVIHIAGILYLLWLAWQTWREDFDPSPEAPVIENHDRRFFRRGFITNVLNAKAFVFYVAVLPGFLTGGSHTVAPAIMLTLISVTTATLVHALIVQLAGKLRPFVTRRATRRHIQQIGAVSLALVALWMVFSGK